MFSRMQLLAGSEEIALRFNADRIMEHTAFSPKPEISGFDHALHPVIIKKDLHIACAHFHWGLVPPDWKKEPGDIWNHTISAKLEYLDRRYAWQKVSQNRCLVPATAYFEYHWNDPKGNSKTKYTITNTEEELFALAGLFSEWHDIKGNAVRTFTVCTTQANDIMKFVHNKDAAKNYHRMPVMLNRRDEHEWLDTANPYMDFAYPAYQPVLTAVPVNDTPDVQVRLF